MEKRILSLILTATMLITAMPISSSANEYDSNYFEPDFEFDFKLDYKADFVTNEVLAPADSQQEAEEIAQAYGLELKSYAYGIAVLVTPNPMLEVVRSQAALNGRSTESGEIPPRLSLNLIYTTSDAWELPLSETLTTPHHSQWHHSEMDNVRAWELSTGEGVIVAVIDTGIDVNHPAFEGRIVAPYNSHFDREGIEFVGDTNGHGTHVSGIISTTGHNDVYGTAPDARIMPIKANFPSRGAFEMGAILRGINYAVENGADIINMSLGRPFGNGNSLEHQTIQNAVTAGVTLIAAGGNGSASNSDLPAAYPEVIAVSATEQNYRFDYSYSNSGSQIAISAPGSGIFAPVIGGGYATKRGTSMAAPNVAGTAALIKSINPDYTPEQIREALTSTANEAGIPGFDDFYGYGIVNSYAAILGADSLISVTYYSDYGGTAPSAVKVAPENKLLMPYAVSNPEYTFLEWHLGEDVFDFSSEITEDITLSAKWKVRCNECKPCTNPDFITIRNIRHGTDLTNLNLSSRRLTNSEIAPLEYMKNLLTLNIQSNRISDISPLSGLTSLTQLFLQTNQIAEIGSLSELTALGSLNLSANQVTDISPLGELTALTILTLNSNQITDLEPVTKLTNLRTLQLWGNKIIDIEPISKLTNLATLNLGNNEIANLTGISSLTGLTWVDLRVNQIAEIESITKLTNLGTLDLGNNQITDIQHLSGLANLTTLSLGGNQISELEPLSGLVNLRTLRLWSNKIDDLTPLSGLINLTSLELSNNDIKNLTGLNVLTNLTTLSLSNNDISNLTGLNGLTNLTSLELNNNDLRSLAGLNGLTGLTALALDRNEIASLEPLNGLTNLTFLSLERNEIVNLQSLSELINLNTLRLDRNQIVNIEPLKTLTKLSSLSLNNNQIRSVEPLIELMNLNHLSLNRNQIINLTPLEALANLSSLHLSLNRIRNLTPLYGLIKLRNLDLTGNHFTPRRADELQMILQDCWILHNAPDNIPPPTLPCEICEICESGNPPVKGRIIDNSEPDIFDTLEILKSIVRIDSVIDYCVNVLNAALIVPERQRPNVPNIFDALEILKYIVGMPSLAK
jgi:internalin A